MDFWGPILGGFPVELPQKNSEKKLRLHYNNFTQKLNFDVLWFRRRAYKKLGRKKRKKVEINLIAAKTGLVGVKGYLRGREQPSQA